jgi:hypothetical protein
MGAWKLPYSNMAIYDYTEYKGTIKVMRSLASWIIGPAISGRFLESSIIYFHSTDPAEPSNVGR